MSADVNMPKIIESHLGGLDYEYVKSGRKTIELRLYDEKRKNIEVGDTISFINLDQSGDKIKVRVIGLSRFSNFTDLLGHLDPIKCGWDEVTNINEMAQQMRKYYSDEDEEKYGVLGIHMELID